MVLQAALKHPKFIPNALDFIDCLASDQPKNSITSQLLSSLNDSAISKSDTEITAHLHNFLQLMERVACEPSINPSHMVLRLHSLYTHAHLGTAGRWETGHALLSVCKALIRTHPTLQLLKDLGDLLMSVWSTHDDIDIVDLGLCSCFFGFVILFIRLSFSPVLLHAAH